MIDKRLVPVGGLKKEPFSGSHNGMRYYMRADENKENGMDAAITWLFEQYEGQKEKWHAASKNCMHIVNQSDA